MPEFADLILERVTESMEKSDGAKSPPRTPDGRYMVVRGRLWRVSNPALDDTTRQQLVALLMDARREIYQAAGDSARIARARKSVNKAKIALGERGPVWWEDGAPDYNRHLASKTPYAEWWRTLDTK